MSADATLSSLAFVQSAALTSSAILLSSGSLSVTGCSFTSLSSSVAGTAISGTVAAGKTMTISSSVFKSCSTSKDGGALSLKLVGDASVSIGADFAGNTASDKGGSVFFDMSTSTLLAADSPITFISTIFGTAGASGSAANGKSVFIDGGSRQISTFLNVTDWDILTKTDLGVVGPVSSFTSKDLEGLPHPSGSTTKPFSFLHLFLGTSSRTPDSTIFVGQSGENQFGCGETKATPCRTVEWSVKEAAGSVVDIVVASNTILSSPIILSNSDFQIAPDSDILCPFVVSFKNSSSAPVSMIRVERNSILTLRSLSMSFSLPASLESVIVASSGIVSVESCVIQKAILSQPFFVSVQSSHTISNTSFLSSTFKTSAFVLSACQSLSIEDTRIANNSFETSFLVISNNSIKQNTSLVELSILPKPTSEDTPTFHVVCLECDPLKYHILPLLQQPHSETGCSCEVDSEAASSFAAKGYTSPFLNWDEHKSQTALETTVLFRSLIATMKFQPSLDDSLEAKAVKFLNSVPTRTQASADSFLTSLVSYSDDLSTDFVQPFMVLISSPNLGLTAAATKMLGNLLFHCSAKFTFTLVKEELIPQLMVTLNPLSLSFEEAVYIHANLMKTITNPVKLATPIGLAILRIKQYSEQQAVYETVFRQVLAPSEQRIRKEPATLSNQRVQRFTSLPPSPHTLLRRHARTLPKWKPSIVTILDGFPII
ncbi:hypothetical protein BLNAU_11834 [Blattamonas nauphoetae]|uniref:Uncharacterized protein n=1 Tax=Blattamonas nauphoetae TaxID=2049346 RepID=A0ABQ9XN79_9EUKA|nr:hypothetical protein BLNAU_11834 [Blattamonas nauphoetae]